MKVVEETKKFNLDLFQNKGELHHLDWNINFF